MGLDRLAALHQSIDSTRFLGYPVSYDQILYVSSTCPMMGERWTLLNQIEKNIAEGMTLEIIPSIPGVFEFVVSKAIDNVEPDGTARTGMKTLRSVVLSTAKLKPFERTAALLAYLLVPGVKEHNKRIKIYQAICYSAVRNGLVPWPRQRRAYLFQDETLVKSAMNRVRRLARHRVTAAMMALPSILAIPHKGKLAVPKRHEMAEIVTDLAMDQHEEDRKTDPENIQYRVWGPSIPVLHLAIPVLHIILGYHIEFLHLLLKGTDDDVPRLLTVASVLEFDILPLLTREDAADDLLAQAEVYDGHVRGAPTLADAWTRLIRFSRS